MNNIYTDTNEATLIGRPVGDIVDRFTTPDGKKFICTQMVTRRHSGIEDRTILTIPADKIHLLNEERLFVQGQYRTYNIDGHLVQRLFVKRQSPTTMADDINEFKFTGTISKLGQVRETPRGKIIVDAIVAINCDRKTSYIPCVIWGTLARYIADSPVGTRISCTSRLQSREYEKIIDDDKLTKTAYEVSILDLDIIGGDDNGHNSTR